MRNAKIRWLMLIIFAVVILPPVAVMRFKQDPTRKAYACIARLEEVGRLDLYAVPGSIATVVHLKQGISSEVFQNPLPQKEREHTACVQGEIRKVAQKLRKVFGVNQVYVEGLSAEVLTADSPALVKTREAFLEVRDGFPRKTSQTVFLPSLPADSESLSSGILEDAFLLLAIEDGFELRPGSAITHEQKESDALTIIAEYYRHGETNRFAPLIACGYHDFHDAVAAWNQTNKLKFSLLSVTSRSLRE